MSCIIFAFILSSRHWADDDVDVVEWAPASAPKPRHATTRKKDTASNADTPASVKKATKRKAAVRPADDDIARDEYGAVDCRELCPLKPDHRNRPLWLVRTFVCDDEAD